MPNITVDSIFIGGPNDDEDDQSNWENIGIPAIYEVCPTCRGEGKSSAYLGTFTQDEMDDAGEHFMNDYFAGFYDKTCETCKGLRVVLVPDRENADPILLAEWDKRENDKYEMEQMHKMELEAEYGLNGY
jgi:hypothetical protein